MAKTLDDAFEGLMRYLDLRPNGGTRTELMALAVQQGFEEPLLATWLNVFLQGLVDIGFINGTGYNQNFVPKVQEVGVPRTKKACQTVYEQQIASGDQLFRVRLQLEEGVLSEQVRTHEDHLSRLSAGRAWMLANAPDGLERQAVLAAVERAERAIDARRAAVQKVLDDVRAQLGG